MTAKKLLVPVLIALSTVAGAQTPTVTGTFVSTLGNDTIQIERYTRTGDKLEGDIARRAPRVQVTHYVADLATGRIKGMSVSTRRFGVDPAGSVVPPTMRSPEVVS